MAITVTHTKVSAIADDPASVAAGEVVPSDWNANHTLSGTVDVNQGGTGASTAANARVNLLPSYTGNGSKALTLNSGATDVQWTTLVDLTTAQTITGVKTLTDPVIVGTILEDVYTISDGAAFEIDPGNGSIQLITLGASRTPKATNFAAGESVTLMVDDGTAYTLTWTDATFGGSGVVWKTNGGVAPTLNTSGYTVIVLWKVSTQVYGARVGDA